MRIKFTGMGLCAEFFSFLGQFLLSLFKGIVEFFIRPARKSVTDDVVLITGAANGIGRLLALGFAKLGSKVILWDVDEKGLSDVYEEVKSFGGEERMFVYVCDVGSREDVYATAARVTSEVGHVTILINNAGIVNGRHLLDLHDEEIKKVMDVNLMAHFWTTKSFLPEMIRRNRGHLATISSSAATIAINRLSDYCASKSASSALLEAVHYELRNGGHYGVHTTLVCPYFIDTGMFDGCITRFNFLFPKLKPEATADRIMEAILTNQEVVSIPRIVYFLGVAKMLLPVTAMDAIHKFFGASSLMDTFQGRKKRT